MSAITVWAFQDNFYLVNKGDIQNATLFRPVVEEVLKNKVEKKLEDRIIDLLSREKIFEIKDRESVIKSIEYFITEIKSSELKKDIKNKSIKFYNELIDKLNEINEKTSKYFVINADSRKEHVRNWVERWSDNVFTPNGLGRFNKGGYILLDISKLENKVTDFVKIEGEEIRLIPNNQKLHA